MRQLEIPYEHLEMFVLHFAKKLQPNTTILLNGEIGAGKTTWTKHLFKNLGYDGVVSSPTFTLIKQYQGDCYSLIHVDAYRNVQGGYIALDDYIEPPYILCVEWSEYIAEELPDAYIQIDITHTNTDDVRCYTIQSTDERYQEEDFVW